MEGDCEGLDSVDAAVGSHGWCLGRMGNVPTFRYADKSQALHVLDLDSVLTCRPIVGALINMLLVRMCFQAGLDKECANIQIHPWSLMLSIPCHHGHWLTLLSP